MNSIKSSATDSELGNSGVRVIIAELLINIARACLLLTLGLFLFRQTQSLWAFASVFIFEALTILVLQTIVGSTVDRFGPKIILLIASSCCFVLAIAITISVSFGQLIMLVLPLVFLHNGIRSFFRVATFALLPSLFSGSTLLKVNAKLAVSLQLGQVSGALLAGLFIEAFGFPTVFVSIAVCYLAAFFCYLGLPKALERKENSLVKIGYWARILQFLKNNPRFLIFTIISSIDFSLVAVLNLLIPQTIEIGFGGQARWLTIIEITFALGAILSGSFSSKLEIDEKNYWIVSMCGGLFTILALTVMMNPHDREHVMILFLFCAGFANTWSAILWLTFLQKISPPNIVGMLGSIRVLINTVTVAILLGGISFFSTISIVGGSFNVAIALLSGALLLILALNIFVRHHAD